MIKLIKYELQIPYSPETEKTVLKKKVWNTNNCDESDSNTVVDVDWMPVAQFFDEFKTNNIKFYFSYKKIINRSLAAITPFKKIPIFGRYGFNKQTDIITASRII
mgnify:CR=1 FL=1